MKNPPIYGFLDYATPAEKKLKPPEQPEAKPARKRRDWLVLVALCAALAALVAVAYAAAEGNERTKRMAEVIQLATKAIRSGERECSVYAVDGVTVKHCVTLVEAK